MTDPQHTARKGQASLVSSGKTLGALPYLLWDLPEARLQLKPHLCSPPAPALALSCYSHSFLLSTTSVKSLAQESA